MDELLRLDFNENGRRTAMNVMTGLGEKGATEGDAAERSGIARQTIADAVEKLETYLLIEKAAPLLAKQQGKNRRNIRYLITDPFLDFFFKVLAPQREAILANQQGALFANIFTPKTVWQIPNFTDQAFERLVQRRIQECARSPGRLHQLLGLEDPAFTVSSHWSRATSTQPATQIDLLVRSNNDHIVRVIECKWTDKCESFHVDEVLAKQAPLSKLERRRNLLCVSYTPTQRGARKIYQALPVVECEQFTSVSLHNPAFA